MTSAPAVSGTNVTCQTPTREFSSHLGMIWEHFISGGSFDLEWRRDCVMIWLREQKLQTPVQ